MNYFSIEFWDEDSCTQPQIRQQAFWVVITKNLDWSVYTIQMFPDKGNKSQKINKKHLGMYQFNGIESR